MQEILEAVPPHERDAWLDRRLGLEEIPHDGPALPRGCAPYLPCPVDTLLRVVEQVGARDVFVDLGSGCGRALAVVHELTGAGAIGIEIQPELVRVSREMIERLGLEHVRVVEGDAAALARYLMTGSVFFLYSPFGGARLEGVLDALEPIARTKDIRICAVQLTLPWRPWLRERARPSEELTVYGSTLARPLGSRLVRRSGTQ